MDHNRSLRWANWNKARRVRVEESEKKGNREVSRDGSPPNSECVSASERPMGHDAIGGCITKSPQKRTEEEEYLAGCDTEEEFMHGWCSWDWVVRMV